MKLWILAVLYMANTGVIIAACVIKGIFDYTNMDSDSVQVLGMRGLYKPRTGHTGRIGRTAQCKNHAPAILADHCESITC